MFCRQQRALGKLGMSLSLAFLVSVRGGSGIEGKNFARKKCRWKGFSLLFCFFFFFSFIKFNYIITEIAFGIVLLICIIQSFSWEP